MMDATELKQWLESLPAGALVGIDEGGLILHEVGREGEVYVEVGGLPLPEGEDDIPW